MTFLHNPIAYLRGVGPQRANLLKNELNIETYRDLLTHFPFKHIDKSVVLRIRDLTQPHIDYVQLKGKITQYDTVGEGTHKRLVAHLEDETGSIDLVWFKAIQWVLRSLPLHQEVLVYGRLTEFMKRYQMLHPEIEPFVASEKSQINRVQPIYSSTEKLKSRGMNTKWFAKTIASLCALMPPDTLIENIPIYILSKESLIERQKAYLQLHFPSTLKDLSDAQRRLKFEEFFIAQVRLASLKAGRYKYQKGIVFEKVGFYFHTFYNSCLPFTLTKAQKRVLKEIRKDTLRGIQMNRLLQGDVGSGKRIVALMSALVAIDNG